MNIFGSWQYFLILDLMILNSMKNASKNICKKEKNLNTQEFLRKWKEFKYK